MPLPSPAVFRLVRESLSNLSPFPPALAASGCLCVCVSPGDKRPGTSRATRGGRDRLKERFTRMRLLFAGENSLAHPAALGITGCSLLAVICFAYKQLRIFFSVNLTLARGKRRKEKKTFITVNSPSLAPVQYHISFSTGRPCPRLAPLDVIAPSVSKYRESWREVNNRIVKNLERRSATLCACYALHRIYLCKIFPVTCSFYEMLYRAPAAAQGRRAKRKSIR